MDAGQEENQGQDEPCLERLLRVLDAELMVSASAGTLVQQRWDSAMADLLALVEPIQPVQEGSMTLQELDQQSAASKEREQHSIASKAAAGGALLYLRNTYRFRPSLVDPAVLDRHEDLFCTGLEVLLGHFDPSVWGTLFVALTEHGRRGRLSTDAMLIMAILVNHGSGVPQDKGLASDLERRAAALSNPVGVFFTCVAAGGDCCKAALMGHSTAALYYSNSMNGRSATGWQRYAIARVLANQGLLLASRRFSLIDLLYSVRGVDSKNAKAWYLVCVKPDSLGDYLAAQGDEILRLGEHGVVIRSAYGETVPEYAIERSAKYFEDFCPSKVCSCPLTAIQTLVLHTFGTPLMSLGNMMFHLSKVVKLELLLVCCSHYAGTS
jgi:hypothetical protein